MILIYDRISNLVNEKYMISNFNSINYIDIIKDNIDTAINEYLINSKEYKYIFDNYTKEQL